MRDSKTEHQRAPTVLSNAKKQEEKELRELDEKALTLVTGGDLRSNGGGKGP
jgi:hypothetical protein